MLAEKKTIGNTKIEIYDDFCVPLKDVDTILARLAEIVIRDRAAAMARASTQKEG